MSNDYDQRRYERLKEIIAEYLDDEGDCPGRFLRDLRQALKHNSDYFYNRADAYATVLGAFK